MEIRQGKLIVGAAGGTAAGGAKTYKVSLPSVWLREIGLGGEQRQLELSFDGEQICIRRRESFQTFAETRKRKGHDVRLLRYYDRQTLCTEICTDFTEKSLRVRNHTTQWVKTAFGRNETPSWEDFLFFLQERCVPRTRAGLREYLEALGIAEYDPLAIIEKSAGRMAEDAQWIEMEVLS